MYSTLFTMMVYYHRVREFLECHEHLYRILIGIFWLLVTTCAVFTLGLYIICWQHLPLLAAVITALGVAYVIGAATRAQ